MKSLGISIALLLGVVYAQAQTTTGTTQQGSAMPTDTAYAVVERGANHRIWERTTYEHGPNGMTVPKIHRYTELASGLNYKDANGQWQESKELIESYPGGAIARQGQYQVIFANDLNSYGAIDMQTPDGKRLRSNILGLMYVDTSTDDAVMIANVKNSTGQLISANQVLYPNAFDGMKADVRYTYRKGGFEQDVILREQPPTPESYGMNPDTTVLEVVTEFLNPPVAQITETGGSSGDQEDDCVKWGATKIGIGKAFDLSGKSSIPSSGPVRKRYIEIQGRTFLIERVRLKNIQSQLDALPLQSSILKKSPVMALQNLNFPQTPLPRSDVKPMKLAVVTPASKGYVLDYFTISSAQTDFTFYGDETYYVSGEYNLAGTTTIEGGAIIKMNSTGQIDIDQNGTLVCKTASYNPAIFTSINDNTVGWIISGSSGAPAFGNVTLFLKINATNAAPHNLRFNYCRTGIKQSPTSATLDVWDCQFSKVDVAVYGYNVGLHNVLIGRSTNSSAAIFVEGTSLVAENVTADYGYAFIEPDNGSATLALTNCLITRQPLIASGYTATLSTNSTAWLPTPSGPIYQVVGGGSYYLTNESSYRDVGTTNISPALLAELNAKTTYPPAVYSGQTISTSTSLSPQVQRDTDGLDIGYHYDPLDYIFGGCVLSTNLTFTPGTAVGWYQASGSTYTSGQPYGICLNNGANISFNGTATQPVHFVLHDLVQEGGNGNWTTTGWMGGMVLNGSGTASQPQINGAFARFETGGVFGLFRDNWAYGIGRFANCELYEGCIQSYRPSLYFTNCLFVRTSIQFNDQSDAASFTIQNCSYYGGGMTTCRFAGQSASFWMVKNTAFDGTDLRWSDNLNGNTNYTAFDYNAYNLANSNWVTYPYFDSIHSNILEVVGPNDLFVTNGYNWQSSWLGDYYLPSDSSLIDAGSTNADLLGLYHFTTQTDQTKEYNSVVDIGYHYVATDGDGNPYDSDGDGGPDYLEDANGNGSVDSGETDWNNANDIGLRVIITNPKN